MGNHTSQGCAAHPHILPWSLKLTYNWCEILENCSIVSRILLSLLVFRKNEVSCSSQSSCLTIIITNSVIHSEINWKTNQSQEKCVFVFQIPKCTENSLNFVEVMNGKWNLRFN